MTDPGFDGPDRRAHKRFAVTCPAVLSDTDGRELTKTRTIDISDGGAMLEPLGEPVDVGQTVQVALRVPRETDNTFMYEDFFVAARVVRHQPGREKGTVWMALQFTPSLELQLEV